MAYLPNYASDSTESAPTEIKLQKHKGIPMSNSMSKLAIPGVPGDESDSSYSLRSTEVSIISDAKSCDSDPSLPPRASSVLEQNLSSWRTSDENYLTVPEKRRPSSVNLEEARTTSNKNKLLGRFFQGRKEKNTETKPIKLAVNVVKLPEEKALIDEAHLYLYETNSLFLNELFLYWNRQLLKRTSKLGGLAVEGLSLIKMKVDDAGDGIDSILNVAASIYDNPQAIKNRQRRYELFPLLCNFYNQIQSDTKLQKSSFRNCKFVMSLVDLLEIMVECTCTGSCDPSTDSEYLMEVMSIELILLDMFRFLIQSNTGTGIPIGTQNIISFSRNGNANWNAIIETLVKIVTSTQATFGEDVNAIMSDPLKFGKLAWRNTPTAPVILLLVMKCNIMVALLHEILTLFLYTPGDHPLLTKFNAIGLNQLLREVITQILSNLTSGGGPQMSKMSPSESVNLFHQVSVIWIMINNFPFVANFLRSNFYEEFKYFVKMENLNDQIPDEYPIKTKIITLFSNIRAEILQIPKQIHQPCTLYEKSFAKKSKTPILNY